MVQKTISELIHKIKAMASTFTITWVQILTCTILIIGGVALSLFFIIRYALHTAADRTVHVIKAARDNTVATVEEVLANARTNIKGVLEDGFDTAKVRLGKMGRSFVREFRPAGWPIPPDSLPGTPPPVEYRPIALPRLHRPLDIHETDGDDEYVSASSTPDVDIPTWMNREYQRGYDARTTPLAPIRPERGGTSVPALLGGPYPNIGRRISVNSDTSDSTDEASRSSEWDRMLNMPLPRRPVDRGIANEMVETLTSYLRD